MSTAIKCRKCRKLIRATARKCPHCGAPGASGSRSILLPVTTLLAAATLIAVSLEFRHWTERKHQLLSAVEMTPAPGLNESATQEIAPNRSSKATLAFHETRQELIDHLNAKLLPLSKEEQETLTSLRLSLHPAQN